MNKTLIRSGLLALVMIASLVACSGADSSKPTTAIITSPVQNTEVMVGQSIVIQGQADGQNIIRVDVIVDSQPHASLTASDPTQGVLSFPVQVTWTAQLAGAHFAQLNVYGLENKLLGKSDAVIFSAKAAPAPAPAPTEAPPPPTAIPTAAPLPMVEVTTTQASTAALTPTLTITNDFANVRGGPGTDYAIAGQLNQNESAPITGKNADGTWWQIVFAAAPNGAGWVRGDLGQASNAANVPAVQAPPAPTAAPATATSNAPTAAPTNVAAATASGPVCDASVPTWKGGNPNYPFCGRQDPTWGDPEGEWKVYDNGRDGPLFISWDLFGSNISQVTIHFVHDPNICGFDRATQRVIDQGVPTAGRFDFNINQFPYGGTYKVFLMVNLTDGRSVQYGEKRLCIR